MSDEMIALLWTFVVLLALVAWIPFLELIKFLGRRYFSPKIGRGGSNVNISQEKT
jgi:hypothetical protein